MCLKANFVRKPTDSEYHNLQWEPFQLASIATVQAKGAQLFVDISASRVDIRCSDFDWTGALTSEKWDLLSHGAKVDASFSELHLLDLSRTGHSDIRTREGQPFQYLSYQLQRLTCASHEG